MAQKKTNIEKVLPKSRKKAIHLYELCDRLKMNEYSVKTCIRKARENGILILSDKCGYWISDDIDERISFIDRIEKNARSRLKTIKTIKQSLKTIKGQKTLKTGGEENGTT